ncbi:hypothetical protein [Burkholderia vietnamiensis]|uniref:hypothetical protein n=1 Tax=Burkholderia vietnamiensis TaxID=60552 RepID=UPI0012D9180D|nr:hypothetical protein [Burkholderia vietnamiensis]
MSLQPAIDIAALKTRVDGHDDAITTMGRRLDRNEEAVIKLRELMSQVATRDDVANLRDTVQTQFFKQLTEARNSIPGKVAALCAVISLLVGLAGFLAGHR